MNEINNQSKGIDGAREKKWYLSLIRRSSSSHCTTCSVHRKNTSSLEQCKRCSLTSTLLVPPVAPQTSCKVDISVTTKLSFSQVPCSPCSLGNFNDFF